MANPRTILIADPDVEVIRQLKQALTDYEVIGARDGSKALELSVLKYPCLILFDRHCALIGATQFIRILRTNPRTENIPLLVMSDAPLSSNQQNPSGVLQGVLVKPLNVDDVRAHVASVLRKVDAVSQGDNDDGEVSGSLEQMSMVDLLQIFSVNRRTGSLQLTNQNKETATVFLREGRIEETITGNCRGEKALYRILRWEEGRFVFAAGKRAPSVSIKGSTDSLLMEGLRQSDELKRAQQDLPSASASLERLLPVESMPEGLHPITAEIVNLVEFYPRIADLIDRAHATDLEVSLALRSLLQAQVLRARESGEQRLEGELVTQEEVFELRTRLRRAGLSPTYLNRPKVALVAANHADIQQLGVYLAQLPGFAGYDLERVVRLGFGRLGTLPLDSGLHVEFYAMANGNRMQPLAYGLSAGTVAALVLGSSGWEEQGSLLRLLEEERRASMLVLLKPGEPRLQLNDESRKVALEIADLSASSCRTAMVTLLKEVMGREDLRGVGV